MWHTDICVCGGVLPNLNFLSGQLDLSLKSEQVGIFLVRLIQRECINNISQPNLKLKRLTSYIEAYFFGRMKTLG